MNTGCLSYLCNPADHSSSSHRESEYCRCAEVPLHIHSAPAPADAVRETRCCIYTRQVTLNFAAIFAFLNVSPVVSGEVYHSRHRMKWIIPVLATVSQDVADDVEGHGNMRGSCRGSSETS